MSLHENEVFEYATALQLMKDVGETFIDLIDIDRIKDVSHLGVAGNLFDVVEVLERGIILSLLERQQGGIFERKHGEGGHQAIDHREADMRFSARILNALQSLTERCDESIGGKKAA